MVNLDFNPFNKEFKSIHEEDLEILKTVCEGWYVEYKENFTDPKKIAKSVASFANAQGGIIFIGIHADAKTNAATNFIGSNIDLDFIHDSIKGNINPFPYYEIECIDIQKDYPVVLIIVPSSDNPPHIHSDGRIYRRQDSSSDPLRENNRSTIDELYKKKEELQLQKDDFRNIDYGFCKGEDDKPFLCIYINTDPFRRVTIKDFMRKQMLDQIFNHFNNEFELSLGDNIIVKGKLNFDSIHRDYESITLKNLKGSNLAYHGITLELDEFYCFKALIPLNYLIFSDYSPEFGKYIEDNYFKSIDIIKFLDINFLVKITFGILYKYITFLNILNYDHFLEFTFETQNCYRTSLYGTSDYYTNYIRKYGLPICLKPTQRYPQTPRPIAIKEISQDYGKHLALITAELVSGFGVSMEDVFFIFNSDSE